MENNRNNVDKTRIVIGTSTWQPLVRVYDAVSDAANQIVESEPSEGEVETQFGAETTEEWKVDM